MLDVTNLHIAVFAAWCLWRFRRRQIPYPSHLPVTLDDTVFRMPRGLSIYRPLRRAMLKRPVGPFRRIETGVRRSYLPLVTPTAENPPDTTTVIGPYTIYSEPDIGILRHTLYQFHGVSGKQSTPPPPCHETEARLGEAVRLQLSQKDVLALEIGAEERKELEAGHIEDYRRFHTSLVYSCVLTRMRELCTIV